MGAIPPSALSRRLERLDRRTFAAFVASLWSACGWETRVDGTVVTAITGAKRQRIGALPPRRIAGRSRPVDPPADVDLLAWAGRGPAPPGTPDVPVLDADDLRERLLFGVEPATAASIGEQYLGVPVRDEHWPARDSGTGAGGTDGRGVTGLPRFARGERFVPTSALSIGLVLAAVTALAVLVASGGLGGIVGDDTRASASAVPEPTCERGPGEVARTVGNALEPPTKGSSGIHVFWAFTDPELRETRHYRGFRGYYEGPRFAELRQAKAVVVDEVVRDDHGDQADVTVVAPVDGASAVYEFDLRRHEDDDARSCWRIRSIVPG